MSLVWWVSDMCLMQSNAVCSYLAWDTKCRPNVEKLLRTSSLHYSFLNLLSLLSWATKAPPCILIKYYIKWFEEPIRPLVILRTTMTGFYWTVAIYQHRQTPRETTCTNGKMCLWKLYIHYINSILIIKSKSVIEETKKLLVVFCRNSVSEMEFNRFRGRWPQLHFYFPFCFWGPLKCGCCWCILGPNNPHEILLYNKIVK